MEPADEGVSGQDGQQLGSYYSLLCNFLHLPGWHVCTHYVCNAADFGRPQTHLAGPPFNTRYGD